VAILEPEKILLQTRFHPTEPIYNRHDQSIVRRSPGADRMPRQSAADIAVPASTRASGRLHPPADLSGPERALFVELVAACSPNHFQQRDLPVCAFLYEPA
jgi:hypothetical protein